MTPTTKRCARCEHDLPVEDFRADPRMRCGLNSWCKRCHLARTQEWRDDNRDALNARRQTRKRVAA
jgi:hypothetical protein